RRGRNAEATRHADRDRRADGGTAGVPAVVGAGDLAGGGVSEPISVRARLERFPATVKGAFIIRGEDPNPHQVVFREARVVAIGGAQAHPIAMTAANLDVAPRRDVFVLFALAGTDNDTVG